MSSDDMSSFAKDMKAIYDGAEKFNAQVRHGVNRPPKGDSPRVGQLTDDDPNERPDFVRRTMPTPKGWQGYTESAEPTWKVSNPNGVKPNQPKAAKAKKERSKKAKPSVERGAIITIHFVDVDKPNLDRPFGTAKEAHEVAAAFYIRKDVRFIRVVTVNGTATLYHEEGRTITPKEYVDVLTKGERDELTKRLPKYQRPDSLAKRTCNGANMTGQVVGNTTKGSTYGRMQRAQGL